ncbi:type II toxin -antitoxin system TacA 1-like antitoxin [Streptomyces beihaiensis]|uniref:DUF1778 domain-containing protein n=1 Tax=Streptomyces beihaiensis TaxID=2984495 RepID=A0ABT3TWF1_9ACTN|nr:DUF1778 domain-containing protein [Streptomyces beihaiensis]MCX3061371.1 DUF1778 domain-containing protein [Streptomyces beihaiensis]
MAKPPKALNLRFPDPAQHAAIEAAARQEGMSMQEYILSAAYARATAVESAFLSAFGKSKERSGDAFRAVDDLDPAPGQREAERRALRDLDGRGQGHAA